MVAKLADFGEAKVKGLNTTRQRLTTMNSTSSRPGEVFAGTYYYQAPEILSKEVLETSRVAEMYSFGVVVWECLVRQVPHKGKDIPGIVLRAAQKKE